MTWRWWRRDPNGAARAAADAQARLRATARMTPVYEQWAPIIADLSDEELARRLRLAMTRRPA